MARSLLLAVLVLILAVPVSAEETAQPFSFPHARLAKIASDGSSVEAFPVVFTAPAPGFGPQLKRLEPLVEKRRIFLEVDGSRGQMTVSKLQSGRYPGVAASDGKVPCALNAFWLKRVDTRGDIPWITAQGAEPLSLKVTDAALRKRLMEMGEGSVVQLEGTVKGCDRTVERATLKIVEVPGEERVGIFLLLSGLLLVALTFLLSSRAGAFLLGKDGLYSSSKFQLTVWFSVFIVTYLVFFLLRFNYGSLVGGISIPTNLFLMSGFSALTFVGAKAITQGNAGKVGATMQEANRQASLATTAAAAACDAATRAAATPMAAPLAQVAVDQTARAHSAQQSATEAQSQAQTFKTAQRKPRLWRDLLYGDDDKPSFSKLQLLVVTAIAAAVYVFKASQLLDTVPLQGQIMLPDVDSALLTAFGLGQGAYLGIKFTGES